MLYISRRILLQLLGFPYVKTVRPHNDLRIKEILNGGGRTIHIFHVININVYAY